MKKTFALTGATGFLGRNFVFELLKQYKDNLHKINIIILGRSQKEATLRERILEIFDQEGSSYLDFHPNTIVASRRFLENEAQYVECNLSDEIVISREEDVELMQDYSIDYFFHFAAVPDLRQTANTALSLQEANIEGTKRLLKLCEEIEVGEFIYVGTAYCSGATTGHIKPDYRNLNQEFNNPYEKSKLLAEMAVLEFGERTGIRIRLMRPSIVCGRLIEKELGHTNKFDVFYQLFAFIFAEKLKITGLTQALFDESVELNMRFVVSERNELNIVPVDYVVKMMYYIVSENHPETSFHLANETNVKLREFYPHVFEKMKVTGIREAETQPSDLNLQERAYYSMGAALFTAYLRSDPKYFDTSNLRQIQVKYNLQCPRINRENIFHLIGFAMRKNYGLDIERILKRAKVK